MTSKEQPDARAASRRSSIVFFVRFAVTFGLLQSAYLLTASYTGAVVVHALNAAASSRIINLVTPSERSSVKGRTITAPGINLDIAKGCEGVEAMFLLVAALSAFPLPLKRKALGIALGGLLIYAVNLLRIVSLYYILKYRPAVFDAMHTYVWQTAIILVAVVFFVVWLGKPSPATRPPAAHAA